MKTTDEKMLMVMKSRMRRWKEKKKDLEDWKTTSRNRSNIKRDEYRKRREREKETEQRKEKGKRKTGRKEKKESSRKEVAEIKELTEKKS